jgi:hypothetical protein
VRQPIGWYEMGIMAINAENVAAAQAEKRSNRRK